MVRLCERPGCSDPASVSYGMRAADMVFWLDTFSDGDHQSHGVLCRRHADSMVLPRNWTLDDIRDPDLRLFRPPPANLPDRPSRRRPARRVAADQLELGIDDSTLDLADNDPADADLADDRGAAPADDTAAAPGDAPDAWTPTFDDADDLDGLLAARSPLLARAFRGADRPRPS